MQLTSPPRHATLARVLAGVLAIAVAAVVVAPQIRFSVSQGAVEITPFGAKDAEFYAAQVRHAADGAYGHANDLLAEWAGGDQKSTPWLYAFLGAAWRATGLDLHVFLTWTLAVAAAGQFLLFAAIGRSLRLSRTTSLAVATACCLAPFLWSYVGGEVWLGHADRITTGFLPLARPVNPSLSSLLVWGAVLALVRWASRPSVALWCGLTALIAATWSAYPAAFLFIGALLAATTIVEAAGRRWRRAAALAAAGAVAVAVNLPSLLRSGAAPTGDAAEVAASNLIGLATRSPILSWNTATAGLIAVAWSLLRLRRRAQPGRAIVVVGAPMALLIVFNLQVLTGRLDQPFHYDWFYAVPLIWMAGAVVASESCAGLRPWATRLTGPEGRRRLAVVAGAIVVGATVVALGGSTSARALRALGVARGEVIARPGLIVAGGVALAVALFVIRATIVAHRWRLLRTVAALAVCAMALREGWMVQDFETQRRWSGYVELQPLRAALRWIEREGTVDDVVASSDDAVARLVPSYTGRNVLISAEVGFAFAPPEAEFRRRRMVNLALFGVSAEALAQGLGDSGRWHGDIFKWRTFGAPPTALASLTGGAHLATLDPAEADRVAATYREILELPRSALLREFRVDWVLWRDASAAVGLRDPGPGDGLVSALDGPGFRLYRVVR
ncbi:MAG: hypothetical protein K8T90_04010 [Planctomycetes bacterium]|nr:hypothetical protein [Planctomycetota bacterium]